VPFLTLRRARALAVSIAAARIGLTRRRPVGLPLVRLPLIRRLSWVRLALVCGLPMVRGMALIRLSLIWPPLVGRLTLVLTRVLLPVRVPWRLAHVPSAAQTTISALTHRWTQP
jgi:hypothetical protein